MQALNNLDFLSLWENAHQLHPLDRGLMAIQASLSQEDRLETAKPVADWPLGRRNRALARLRTLYFGPYLQGWTVCTECGEQLEFKLDCRTLEESPQPQPDLRVSVKGAIFRLPTSRDLARIAGESDVSQAALKLLSRCEIESAPDVPEEIMQRWSTDTIEEISAKMAESDPLAEISVGFDCPICHHTSEEDLDLPSFLWTEIESRAHRLISEVHTLAAAYGWAESMILSMSDLRRAAYLRMVQA
jgi:hypothetical protein